MKRAVIIFFSFIALFGVLGAAGWWYYRTHKQTGKTGESDQIEIPDWYYTDKDGDLIPDEKEKELGTDPLETDTDHDGLSDQSEIDVYGTDPKNQDTDGDGFSDGFELLRGHNPLEKAPTNQ